VKSEKHLYSGGLGKTAWFIRRFGIKEVFYKPLRTVMAPWILRRIGEEEFRFAGTTLRYTFHQYNCTWINERCVEIPIARHFLERYDPKEVLEVGNVLAHYTATSHEVVDKYEQGKGVINRDILEFKPDTKYRLIISISTFEHIGYDDSPTEGSGTKIPQALAACKDLLAPDGKLVITVPIGYNSELDRMISNKSLGATQQYYMRRTGKRRWTTCDWPAVAACRYGTPHPYANAIMIAEF
jgi:hypothetical protein